jgi:hypothetical protein
MQEGWEAGKGTRYGISRKLGITFGTGAGSIHGDGPLGTKGNGNNTAFATTPAIGGVYPVTDFDASRVVPTAAENRPANTAYFPRIHV